MHPNFARVIKKVHPSFKRLLQMPPTTTDTLPKRMPRAGVYLFSEKGRHLYVGRSNRLRARIHRHGTPYSRHNVASFAFKMARKKMGKMKASYRTEGSRQHLLKDPRFLAAFDDAKRRIRKMQVRFIEETDQTMQSILELYVAIVFKTPFNDFDTH